MRTITETLQVEEDGIRVDGKLYRFTPSGYWVAVGRAKRRKGGDRKTPALPWCRSPVINEHTRSVLMVAELKSVEAYKEYLSIPCKGCSPEALGRALFDGVVQHQLAPVRKRFRGLYRLHAHGERMGVEVGFWLSHGCIGCVITHVREDPMRAAGWALMTIDHLVERGFQMVLPPEGDRQV